MNNVKSLDLPKTYPKIGELQDRVNDLILEYEGELGFLEVLGVLEFMKSVVIARQWESIED